MAKVSKISPRSLPMAAEALRDSAGGGVAGIAAGDRRQMIEQAAYYKAELRGFQNGSSEHDWFEAERDVDRFLSVPIAAEAAERLPGA